MKLWMAPSGLHVEPAVPEDAPALARLHARAFYRGWPESEFFTLLADPDIRAYVACDRRRRISGFALLRLAADEGELLTIVVDRAWRGKKLGRALLEAALADLMTTPTRALFLEVDEANAAAIGLYERFGFSRVGTRRGYYPKADGSAATALVMRRDLG